MTNNPLSHYFRHPDLYIPLPSQGRWWPKDAIILPESGEVAISSMNGLDDIAMRNADGLMNGETSVKVIQSCCPNIKDAWNMPNVDIDSVFIAIRIASYGHQMDQTTKCAKCGSEIDYAVDLRYVLSNITVPNYDEPIEIGELMFFLKPATFKIMNLNNQEIYQQQRTIMALRDSSLTNDQKEAIVKEAIVKLTNITVNRLYEYVDRVMLKTGEVVTDETFIKEFIENADRDTFNKLKDSIQTKNAEYKLPSIPVKCGDCGHEDTREMMFEPANFFGSSS